MKSGSQLTPVTKTLIGVGVVLLMGVAVWSYSTASKGLSHGSLAGNADSEDIPTALGSETQQFRVTDGEWKFGGYHSHSDREVMDDFPNIHSCPVVLTFEGNGSLGSLAGLRAEILSKSRSVKAACPVVLRLGDVSKLPGQARIDVGIPAGLPPDFQDATLVVSRTGEGQKRETVLQAQGNARVNGVEAPNVPNELKSSAVLKTGEVVSLSALGGGTRDGEFVDQGPDVRIGLDKTDPGRMYDVSPSIVQSTWTISVAPTFGDSVTVSPGVAVPVSTNAMYQFAKTMSVAVQVSSRLKSKAVEVWIRGVKVVAQPRGASSFDFSHARVESKLADSLIGLPKPAVISLDLNQRLIQLPGIKKGDYTKFLMTPYVDGKPVEGAKPEVSILSYGDGFFPNFSRDFSGVMDLRIENSRDYDRQETVTLVAGVGQK